MLPWATGAAIGVASFRYQPRVWDGMISVGVFASAVVLTIGRADSPILRSQVGAAVLLVVVLFPFSARNVVSRTAGSMAGIP